MSVGFLGAAIRPPYIGLACNEFHNGAVAEGEPFDDLNYSRGQIEWRVLGGGVIVGKALVYAPKGLYTHVVFFWGPSREHLLAGEPQQLEHPVPFDRPGFIEIDPIGDADYLPRLPA
jgi:hypothetical protein